MSFTACLPFTRSSLINLFSILLFAMLILSGADQALAQPEGAPAQPAAAPESGSEGVAHEGKSYLYWIIESSGWIGAIILVCSIYMVAKIFQQMSFLRMQNIAPPELIEQTEELLKARDFAGVYRLVKEDDSYLGEVLTAGLGELQHGLAEAREAMDLTAEVRTTSMERDIAMLAVLGTLGPMIGLLGTLKGMIAAFSVIAIQGAQLNATQVAGDISEALILTFEGVGLSLPAIFFYSLLKNRISTFTAETLLIADTFVRRLNMAYRSGGAPTRTET